jgi:hypothetical protein
MVRLDEAALAALEPSVRSVLDAHGTGGCAGVGRGGSRCHIHTRPGSSSSSSTLCGHAAPLDSLAPLPPQPPATPHRVAVDRYLIAVQDYLPGVLAGGATSDPTHAALLQQLQPLTPQLLDGSQLYSVVAASRLLPCGCERCVACMGMPPHHEAAAAVLAHAQASPPPRPLPATR